jgi:hypothetical protein
LYRASSFPNSFSTPRNRPRGHLWACSFPTGLRCNEEAVRKVEIVANAYSGTFFVTLKEWGERTRTEEHTKPIQARWNWDRGTLSEGIVFSFSPPLSLAASPPWLHLPARRPLRSRRWFLGRQSEHLPSRGVQTTRAGWPEHRLPAVMTRLAVLVGEQVGPCAAWRSRP